MERNSKRRSAKLPETLLNIEDIGESSDDSDFRIEDHCLDDSDSSDRSEASDSSDESSDSEGDDSDDDSKKEVSSKVAPKLSETSVLQSSTQVNLNFSLTIATIRTMFFFLCLKTRPFAKSYATFLKPLKFSFYR